MDASPGWTIAARAFVLRLASLEFILVAAQGCGARTQLDLDLVPGPCAGAPATPISVEAPTGFGETYGPGRSLTVTSDSVYFETGPQVDGPGEDGIARVSLVGAVPQPASLTVAFRSSPGIRNYAEGTLAHDGVDLYFPTTPGTLGQTPGANVAAEPLGGGPPFFLPDTSDPVIPSPAVIDLAATPARGALWLAESVASVPDACWLAAWDATKVTTVASFPEACVMMVADTREAFVQTTGGLYFVSLSGGGSTRLRSLPPIVSPPENAPPTNVQLLGLNADALFYSPDGTNIVCREVSSGTERTLLAGISLTDAAPGLHNGVADSSSLYYTTGTLGFALALNRLPVDGGTPELISNDPNHAPTGAVATDACNIYWLAGSAPYLVDGVPRADGPSTLMVRRRD